MEAAARTEPTACDQDAFDKALHAMTPMNWRNFLGMESFMLSERYTGMITKIFVREQDRFWSFRDRMDLTEAQIFDKIRAAT